MDATIRGEEGERSRNPERGAGSAMTARDPLHEDPLRPELPALFSRLGALRPPAARASSLPVSGAGRGACVARPGPAREGVPAGSAAGAARPERNGERTWAGVRAPAGGWLWARQPGQPALLCVPDSELGKCCLARWLAPGRLPGRETGAPAELTPELCLVANVNAPDGRGLQTAPQHRHPRCSCRGSCAAAFSRKNPLR
ncbi:hypothetical protein NN561_012591 [Cricetulus griseus]